MNIEGKMKTPKEWVKDCMERIDLAGAEASASEVIEVVVMRAVEEAVSVTNLQKSEHEAQLEWAWSIIASAGPEGCIGNWKKMDPRWVEAAEKWRDKYHEILRVKRKEGNSV